MMRYAALVTSAIWCLVVICFLLGNVIVRETRLAVVARMVDSLPPRISNLAFTLLWIVFLLGWCVPLVIGLRGFRGSARD